MGPRNDRLRQARLGRSSPSGSGRAMSRQELAEAVNAFLLAETGGVYCMSASHLGKLELGDHHWPREYYRRALRAVLGARCDADLGFYISRSTQPVPAEMVPGPESEHSPDADGDHPQPAVGGGQASGVEPAVVAVVVPVPPGQAVTVMWTTDGCWERDPDPVPVRDDPAPSAGERATAVIVAGLKPPVTGG